MMLSYNTADSVKAGMVLLPLFSFHQYSFEDDAEPKMLSSTPILSHHFGLHREAGITCEEAPKFDLPLSDMVGCSVDTRKEIPRLRIVSYPKHVEQSKFCCGNMKEKRKKQVCFLEPYNLTYAQATVVANLWGSLLTTLLIMHQKFEIPSALVSDMQRAFFANLLNQTNHRMKLLLPTTLVSCHK